MEIDERPIISFCIATYNRSAEVKKIVEALIAYHEYPIEIIVSDDGSSDDTLSVLGKIQDSRLHVYTNKINLGPTKNWYQALQHGSGEYLFQLLDRDMININYITPLIGILKSNNIAFAYTGASMNALYDYTPSNPNIYIVYERGEEALKKFACVPNHPTGTIFRKNEWIALKEKKKFFYNKYWGVYPHGYVFAIMAQEYAGAVINLNICRNERISGHLPHKSHFYEKQKAGYWWEPQERYRDLIRATTVINSLNVSDETKTLVIEERFRDSLYSSTIIYSSLMMDKEHIRRYGIEQKRIRLIEQIVISVFFYLQYIRYLKEKRCNEPRESLNKVFLKHIFLLVYNKFLGK